MVRIDPPTKWPRSDSVGLWLLLANIVTPLPECLDDLWQDCSSKWDSEEDQGLVNQIGEAQLRPNCCSSSAAS